MPKNFQRIAWRTIPIFYNLFGLIFVLLTRVMPPPRPDAGPEQIVAFFHDHSLTIRIGFAILMVEVGFTGVANGLIALQIKRISVAPVFAYGYTASLVVGALPGCVIPGFASVAATFRDRSPLKSSCATSPLRQGSPELSAPTAPERAPNLWKATNFGCPGRWPTGTTRCFRIRNGLIWDGSQPALQLRDRPAPVHRLQHCPDDLQANARRGPRPDAGFPV